ncbi:hypothetical protein TWF481_002196 [Arthrobotrys musiformis]|uniref:Uncharacterized protein n=1 Tax=Arthrobotrys musiformis TaxID=47236 RepID=A0AAV9VTQ2_9PEZI
MVGDERSELDWLEKSDTDEEGVVAALALEGTLAPDEFRSAVDIEFELKLVIRLEVTEADDGDVVVDEAFCERGIGATRAGNQPSGIAPGLKKFVEKFPNIVKRNIVLTLLNGGSSK